MKKHFGIVMLASISLLLGCGSETETNQISQSVTVVGQSSHTDIKPDINNDGLLITKEEFSEKWPFTVEEGRLKCINSMVIFTANGKSYGINGMARQHKYTDPDEIWKDNPDLAGTKISISPIIDKGLELCK